MSTQTSVAFTLPFSKFWTWVQSHPNCILRAGTPEAVLFDDDDLHWHFSREDDGTLIVQLMRGKKLYGELAVTPGDVTYVQAEPGDGGVAAYHFVLSHGYDEEESSEGRRFTH